MPLALRNVSIEPQDPELVGLERIHPENVMVKLATIENPRDIGSLAYSRRELGTRDKETWSKGLKVDKGSLIVSRRPFILNFLDYIHSTKDTDNTIRGLHYEFNRALRWFDENGHEEVLSSVKAATAAYWAYTEHLRDGLLNKLVTAHAAFRDQQAARILFKYAFPDDYRFINASISRVKKPPSGTEAPRTKKVEDARDVFLTTFETIADCIINHKPYPWKITYKAFTAYAFPIKVRPFLTPYQSDENNGNRGSIPYPFDYETGKIFDYKTIKESLPRYYPPREYRVVMDNLAQANSDKYHAARWSMATLAMRCYIQLFNFSVAANTSTLQTIPWDSHYQLRKEKFNNNFGSVKLRAKGKLVIYPLGRRGITLFKKFLKLRDHILDGQECEWLFFSKRYPHSQPKQLTERFYSVHWKKFRGSILPGDFKTLTTGEMRLWKTNDMKKADEDDVVVADSLQHGEGTSNKIYSKGTAEDQESELGKYWASVKSVRIKVKDLQSAYKDVEIAAGHCVEYNHPVAGDETPPIQPDCNRGQGCLFCANYACHADETDVRKLLSLLFVAQMMREYLPDYKRADEVYQALELRIKGVIVRLRRLSCEINDMIDRIEEEIFEYGELSTYWELKVRRLERVMGLQ
ncbi:hypothetical protein [Vibrio cyclitrophicus]|uniref:hypothetical protein n=1 Tax=Vibrio cyclitrophicus TaxID=47951 RepID=UPI00080DFB80|nr:hypothetical protein [Vibrio cyclitrophicus]OCH41932.1 hypothetical protein A6E07_08145 [Vibrio cyclitrophicus]